MKTLLKHIKGTIWVIMVMGCGLSWANNVQITNGPLIKSRDMDAKQAVVTFDVSWDNSWNTSYPNNHDAIWVFMKYRIDASPFEHAYLVQDPGIVGDAGTSPVDVKYGTSKLIGGEELTTGVFLARKSGTGTTTLKNVGLVWNLDGTDVDENSVVSVRVFAIEMVYVPEGAFHLGDNASIYRLMNWGDTIFRQDRTPLVYGTPLTASNHPDNIIPTMTSNTAPEGYVASASGASYAPYLAFNRRGDNTTGVNWYYGTTGAYGNGWDWIQLQFPEPVNPTWGIFQATYYTSPGNCPSCPMTGFCIQGSNDGINWAIVHGDLYSTETEQIQYGQQNYNYQLLSYYQNPVVFDNPGKYRYFRFWVRQHNSYYNGMGIIMLMEHGEDRVNKIFSEDPKWFALTAHSTAATAFDTLKEAFPKGYKAFYVMKHEVTQAAWVDFLNTLTVTQQQKISHISPTSTAPTKLFNNTRMNIRIKEQSSDMPAVYGCSLDGLNWNHENNGGNTPMFNLAWTDIAAYLAWSCLRPMTELEYEKACRGPEKPVMNEYAWGNPYLTDMVTSVTYPHQPNESPIPALANHCSPNGVGSSVANWNSNQGYWPVRAGAFARAKSTRVEAGASFWGILNLTDNVPERVINIEHADGRKFTGEHGAGTLRGDGYADVPNWPAQNVALAGTANGTGYRGVDVSGNTIYPCRTVSYRGGITYSHNQRDLWTGCRGVRTAE